MVMNCQWFFRMEEKSTHINKEDKTMSEKAKAIHNAYCDYEVAKAKQPSRIYSVRSEVKRKPQGIKTHNMSKAMLAQTLASLF